MKGGCLPSWAALASCHWRGKGGDGALRLVGDGSCSRHHGLEKEHQTARFLTCAIGRTFSIANMCEQEKIWLRGPKVLIFACR